MYLIARDRFAKPWMGLLFAVVYLMYAPIQWISWANFHPEALVIAPLLYAWWFASHADGERCSSPLLIALSIREDTALVGDHARRRAGDHVPTGQGRPPRSDDGAVHRSGWASCGTRRHHDW